MRIRGVFTLALMMLLVTGCSKKFTADDVKAMLQDQKSSAVFATTDNFELAVLDSISISSIEQNGSEFLVTINRPDFNKLYEVADSDTEFKEVYSNCETGEDRLSTIKDYYVSLLSSGQDVWYEDTTVVTAVDGEISSNWMQSYRDEVSTVLSTVTFTNSSPDDGGTESVISVDDLKSVSVGDSFVTTQGEQKFLVSISSVTKGEDALSSINSISPANEAINLDSSLTPVFVRFTVTPLNDKSIEATNYFKTVTSSMVVKQFEGVQIYGVKSKVSVTTDVQEMCTFLAISSDDLILWYNENSPEVYSLMF